MVNYKFLYFTHNNLQIPRVARQCIVALCDTVAGFGIDTEIITFKKPVSKFENNYKEYKELYSIKNDIKITEINEYGHYAIRKFESLSRFIKYSFFLINEYRNGKFDNYSKIILTARNYSIFLLLRMFSFIGGKKFIVVSELHGPPSNWMQVRILKMMDGIICISESLKCLLISRYNFSESKIRFGHSGYLDNATKISDKVITQNKYSIPKDKIIITYTGKVYFRYEEIEYYLDCAQNLSNKAFFLIVGGRADHVIKWKEVADKRNIGNVKFIEFLEPEYIPDILEVSDILLLYYSRNPINDYRSPAKLFNYLKSGKIIVTGNFKSVKEIITDGINGFTIEPYKPGTLSKKLIWIADNLKSLNYVGRNAAESSVKYNWGNRASAYLKFFNS